MCVQRQTTPEANNLFLIVPQIKSKDLLPFNTEEIRTVDEERMEGEEEEIT